MADQSLPIKHKQEQVPISQEVKMEVDAAHSDDADKKNNKRKSKLKTPEKKKPQEPIH